MIIEKIQNIKHEEEFIKNHVDEKLLLINHYTNDFYIIKSIIDKCSNITGNFCIEVGGNFFLISKVASNGKHSVRYWLSNRILEEVMKEVK